MSPVAHPQNQHCAIVVNQQLPLLAKLSKATFMERVANLEAIRTRKVPVSLLLGEKSQMAQLEVLHAAVQTGVLPPWAARLSGWSRVDSICGRNAHAAASVAGLSFVDRSKRPIS